ncbi:uncharacterized protein BDZ99DRAFT_574380 [Mytilinidion resinicola]|uniref:Uncharacterized protein n=1 Tax=Mytilinidion resinicola TaxID=574789 RepID=A0A6A6YBF1_9PEZI|nr:uncharacterized protein BDZ99DRAFT_574380 [Mytilinidion resinicola]KAF2805435.1 hypothetical protein BDZ99DRAFT_574380 [Mytilinidion resinicola]
MKNFLSCALLALPAIARAASFSFLPSGASSSSSSSHSFTRTNSSTILSTSLSSSRTRSKSSSAVITTTSSSVHFIVPTVTSTIPFSFGVVSPSPKPTSSGGSGGFVVVNPANPTETVGFTTTKLPAAHRSDYPDATDLAPLALLGLLFLGAPLELPALLFGGGVVVFPFASEAVLASAAAWLALESYPDPDEVDEDNHDKPTSKPSDKPSSTKSRKSSSRSSSSSSSKSNSIPTITETVAITLSSMEADIGTKSESYFTIDQNFYGTTIIITDGTETGSMSSASSTGSVSSSSVSSSSVSSSSISSSRSRSSSSPSSSVSSPVSTTESKTSHSSKSSHSSSPSSSSPSPTSSETKTLSSTKKTSHSSSPSPSKSAEGAAPPVTATIPTITPSCIQGYATPTAHAIVSANAKAPSIKIYVPAADNAGTNWNVVFDPGFGVDPANNMQNWQVVIDPQGNGGFTNIVASGATSDPIKWTAPAGAKGTFIQLLFNKGLGKQTYGLDVLGDAKACMPTCQEPPTTVTRNGAICIKNGCSNDVNCQPTSTPIPNPAGTDVHVRNGCASINGSPRCDSDSTFDSKYNVADNNQPYASAAIYGNFDKTNSMNGNVQPGCKLQAQWPANYGDVYFDVSDGCLYDSGNSKIWDECCTDSTTDQISNPYEKVAASCQRTPGVGFVHFEIYSNGWITDGGKTLHDEINGCTPTSVTSWSFGWNHGVQKDGSAANLGDYDTEYLAKFNIDLFFKNGCVGRAIASAGGPAGVDC